MRGLVVLAFAEAECQTKALSDIKGRYGVRARHLAFHQRGSRRRSEGGARRIPFVSGADLTSCTALAHGNRARALAISWRAAGADHSRYVVRALEGSAFAITRAEERDAQRDPRSRRCSSTSPTMSSVLRSVSWPPLREG